MRRDQREVGSMDLLAVALIVAHRETTSLAESALPNAPVVLESEGRTWMRALATRFRRPTTVVAPPARKEEAPQRVGDPVPGSEVAEWGESHSRRSPTVSV